jgi:menaquinone-dependent protoporphyrinogen oxidase
MAILIIYSTAEGQTRKIAERMADIVRETGRQARLTPIEGAWQHSFFPAPDAAIVAASIHVGKHSEEVTRFVKEHRMQLDAVPNAFISVSMSASSQEKHDVAEGYLNVFLTETGWQPVVRGVVGGALRYSQYGMLKRAMIRHMARKEGLPTDTSRDHEFTDWEAVSALTRDLLARVEELSTV